MLSPQTLSVLKSSLPGGRGKALIASGITPVANAGVTRGAMSINRVLKRQSRLEKAQASAEKLGYGKVRGGGDLRLAPDGKEVDGVVIAGPGPLARVRDNPRQCCG